MLLTYGFISIELNKKFGLYNSAGKLIAPIVYDKLYRPKEGMFLAGKNNLYGFLDENGAEKIAFIYSYANNFVSGKAPVSKDGKYYEVDKTGKCVSNCPPGL